MDIYSKLDSDRFGIKVGKISDDFFSDKEFIEGINYFIEHSYDLIIGRMTLKNVELINQLEKCGFTFKDVQQTYYYDLKDFDVSKLPKKDESYTIREFKISDTNRLVELARMCFDNYGHYFENNKLKHDDCLDVYGDWAYNSCINKDVADKIFVAEKDNEVAGYLSFKIKNDKDKIYAVGGMGAVDPKHRGKGVFQDIAVAALQWGSENNFNWEEHNVLINNGAVNRTFTRIGFKPSNTVMTLHGWVNEINL